MEAYLAAGGSQNLPLYNCSNFTSEEWTARYGVKHPVSGIYSIILGTISLICYIPCIFAMCSKDLIRYSYYKIMLCLAFSDIIGILVACIFHGYFMIRGYVFCSIPEIGYIHGCGVMGSWCTESALCFTLAVNRVLEICYPRLAKRIFSGSKTYLILMIPLTYGLVAFIIPSPALFNSAKGAEFFDPGIFDNMSDLYQSSYQHANNAIFCLGNSVLYILLCVVFYKNFKEYLRKFNNKMGVHTFIQATIISTLNIIVAFIYVLMQYFNLNPIWVHIGQAGYQLIHCCPAFVYLLMNRSIRGRIQATLFCRKENGAKVSGQPNLYGSNQPHHIHSQSRSDKQTSSANEHNFNQYHADIHPR